ncbi:hypothetical protein ACHAWF_002270 [Thalassiosira exigua]
MDACHASAEPSGGMRPRRPNTGTKSQQGASAEPHEGRGPVSKRGQGSGGRSSPRVPRTADPHLEAVDDWGKDRGPAAALQAGYDASLGLDRHRGIAAVPKPPGRPSMPRRFGRR